MPQCSSVKFHKLLFVLTSKFLKQLVKICWYFNEGINSGVIRYEKNDSGGNFKKTILIIRPKYRI